MRCVICKSGHTEPGRVTVTLERGSSTLVIKGVPAQVCANCGEEYVDQVTSAALLESAEAAVRSGVHVAIQDYAAA